MKARTRIVSGGTSQTTKVFIGEQELTGITRVEIEPIEAGQIVRAKITLMVDELELNNVELRNSDRSD